MKALWPLLLIGAAFPTATHAIDISTLCAEGCRVVKVSDGFYRVTSIGPRGKSAHYLAEEVDMRGLEGTASSTKTSTQSSESILTKSLWERQHEAYQRLQARGELITTKEPPPPKEPTPPKQQVK